MNSQLHRGQLQCSLATYVIFTQSISSSAKCRAHAVLEASTVHDVNFVSAGNLNVAAAGRIISTSSHAQTSFGASTSTAERPHSQRSQRRMPRAGAWQHSSQSPYCPAAARWSCQMATCGTFTKRCAPWAPSASPTRCVVSSGGTRHTFTAACRLLL